MARMRDDGATLREIADHFHLHHTTVMHHLDVLGSEAEQDWLYSMEPHDVRVAQLMRAAGSTYAEIARALHYSKPTVRRTLMNPQTQRELITWLAAHPLPDPPSAA